MANRLIAIFTAMTLLSLHEAHNIRSIECWQGGPQDRTLVRSSFSHCQFVINTESAFISATTRSDDPTHWKHLMQLVDKDVYNCGVKWNDFEGMMQIQCSCYTSQCNWIRTLEEFFYSGLNVHYDRQIAENIDEQLFI